MLIRYLQNFYTICRQSGIPYCIRKFSEIVVWFIFGALILSSGTIQIHEYPEKVRQFTHTIEFDYVDWTLKAIGQKYLQSALSVEDYLPNTIPPQIVREYIHSQAEIANLEAQITVIYADPNIPNKSTVLDPLHKRLESIRKFKDQLAPYAESMLQKQISSVLAENGLTLIGQPVPPVLYHSTPLPMALIVSPRDVIQQDANISLLTDMTAGDMNSLEDQVMQSLDVSALVVPVGGVGVYPTMVMATSDLPYLVDTIAHEWTHNFLTMRPLGLNYETNSTLRTINETTASIAGKEIGNLVLKKYYPDLLAPEQNPQDSKENAKKAAPVEVQEVRFNYRQEMHATRVKVDELLSEGKIKQAEDYMEQRRKFFWENGYPIRRLNQAYFAFYGAYADSPGGAAGKDPVGPVVRAFRRDCASLRDFLDQISWITSFDQLKAKVGDISEE